MENCSSITITLIPLLENVDDDCGNDDVGLEEEVTALEIESFVNASRRFRNSFRLNLIRCPCQTQGIW
jgi:hypothetical protein